VRVTPYIQDPDFTLYVGDVREVLRELPAESVDCVVTSPPYWGLRDYGMEGQIGLEESPEAFVAEMVAVFREVRRVLAPHGTLWLNLGDSYAGSWGNQGRKEERGTQRPINGEMLTPVLDGRYPDKGSNTGAVPPGLKPKDLVGIPWRVAFALQADGWYLRSDVIWGKPNPMPESVTDRPTKSHEYVFLLSKQPRYFFDQEAVREKSLRGGDLPGGDNGRAAGAFGVKPHGPFNGEVPANRNIRSVWEIATQPYPEAHFATFPEALPERCIKAGCPERVCVVCGRPSERLTESLGPSKPNHHERTLKAGDQPREGGNSGLAAAQMGSQWIRTTLGWSSCLCAPLEIDGRTVTKWRPGVVLDPFMGSGTTALVARRLGRRSIGVELNESYAALCARRLSQLSLLAEGLA
jgi:DNA modification methylase